jgi:hypothetical protein
MSKLRVCLYGSTELDGAPTTFVSALAEKILMEMPAVIVTGGFLRRHDCPTAVSTDSAALEGARRFASNRGIHVRDVFEAWVPEHRLDGRPDVGGVVRMSTHDGVTVRVIAGRTALGRRLAMVGGVDVVVTISGKRHTEVVLEQAIELHVPALPIPHAGGDSKTVYDAYRDRIEAAFAPGAVRHCFDVLEKRGLKDEESVRCVVDVIRSARVGRCLVLQPYRTSDDDLYEAVIRPTVAEQMQPVRLKDASGSDEIYSSFFDAVSYSTTIVADVTQLNANVMYEIGYAHGRGLRPLLFTLDASKVRSLPIYLRTLNVHAVTQDELPSLISQHLRDAKAARGDPMLDEA